MSGQPAARVGDDIAHTNAGLGMLLGVLAGAAVGTVLVAATVATGGLALVAAAGAAAGLVSAGGLGGMYIGEASMGPACGKFVSGAPTVLVNGRPATFTFGSFAACAKDTGSIPLATGSSTVRIAGGLAGRKGEKLGCSALSVAKVSPNVIIGGASAQDPRVAIQPEVPGWAVTGLKVLGIAGLIATLPFSVATVGVAATLGGLTLGFVGAAGGAAGGRLLGEKLGLSESGIRALEVGGGFLGGMVGGKLGVGKGSSVPVVAEAEAIGAAEMPGIAPVEQPVYRVDGRPAGTIFDEGFQPRGTSTDLENYVNTNQPSTFISTSKTPAIADNPAFGQPGKTLYEIDGTGLKGIDVNKAYPTNPFANENEIAIPSGIPKESIISARPILPNGTLGEPILNPNYNGGK